MTVKIDRFQIVSNDHGFYSKSGKSRGIIDFLEYKIIMSFDTDDETVNQELAEIMLKELNTGKYNLKV